MERARELTATWGFRRPVARAGLAAIAVLAAASTACGGAASEAESPVGVSGAASERGAGRDGREAPAQFAFESLDARPVSSAALRGKVSVLTFFTTGNIASQAQVNYLMAMAKHDAEQVNYAIVAMEPRTNRELIELYRAKLGVPFPTAIADAETLAGRGGFGDLEVVPVTVVLDRGGRIVWRHVGIVKADEIRGAMHMN